MHETLTCKNVTHRDLRLLSWAALLARFGDIIGLQSRPAILMGFF
jgi:hypothetical protein